MTNEQELQELSRQAAEVIATVGGAWCEAGEKLDAAIDAAMKEKNGG